ncbi:MAG: acyltransferase [Lachnospiraceae bacterium]|nr:acyltransferase [Lachnospiraceae bacterium]
MGQGKRLYQIGNIRAFAIVLVVLGHCIILYSSAWGLYETEVRVPFLNVLKKIVDIPQMPIFFSLSGYLFMFTRGKNRDFVHLLKDKALRLLVPYFGIGLCFLLPIRVSIGFHSYQNMGVMDVVQKLLTSSDVGHLWFLPVLFCVFLLSEIILTVAEKILGVKKYQEFFLCFVAFVLYLEGYRIGFGYPPLLGAFNYLLWFSLGYAINVWQGMVKRIYGIMPLKWALVILNLILIAYSVTEGPMRVMLTLLMKVLCVVNTYGVMPEKTCKIVEKIERNSFGIYLFHSPLIYITFANIPNAHPVIVVSINLLVFGAVAFGLTDLVRKSKLKVLIGE